MNVKQEHCETRESDTTESVVIYGQTEENYSISIKPEKLENNDEDDLSYMYGIFESQVTEQLVSLDEFKQDVECEISKIEQRSDLVDVDEQVHIFPSTSVKPELENTTKVEEADIGSIKQEVCEYVRFKNESEFLTSHCDLPTLKSESDCPDYCAPSCSSEEIQQTLKNSLECVSENCSQLHPCLDCQKNYPSSQSGLKIDGHLKDQSYFVLFNDSPQLSNHVTVYPDERRFKCDVCFKEFDQQFRLEEHLKDHSYEKPFKCDVCFKGFKAKSSLERHLVLHTSKKRYDCDICYKHFNYLSVLRKHLKTHKNEKPSKCDICAKEFTTECNLRRHLEIHTNEKPFKCNICSTEFNHKSDLRNHLLMHTNKKSFKCDICSKEFARKTTFQRHLVIHSNTNEKPFKCDKCSAIFRFKSSWQRHVNRHKDKKPFYKCRNCSREFIRKCSLEQHLISYSNMVQKDSVIL